MKKKLWPFLSVFGIILLLYWLTKFIPISDLDGFIYGYINKILNINNVDVFFTDSKRYVFLIIFVVYIFGISFSKLVRRILVFGFLPMYFCVSLIMITFHFYDFAISRNIIFFLLSYLAILFYYYVKYEKLHNKEISDSKLLSRIDGDGVFEEITVLFVDIQNYTGISERLESPTLISKFLNYYIGYIENIIVKYDGILDKVMGDGIMLIFRGKNKEKRAARFALEVLKKKDKFVETLKNTVVGNLQKGFIEKENIERGVVYSVLKEFKFNFRIGMSTGSVFMGNIGGKSINATTVIGEVVNIASRLEGLNKTYKTNILIDQKTALALGNDFVSRFVDKIRIRGKSQISNIYQPFRYKNDIISIDFSDESLNLWNQFMSNYYKRNYDDAFAIINSYINLNPKDKLSILYYNRVHAILNNMVKIPMDWDGTRESNLICD